MDRRSFLTTGIAAGSASYFFAALTHNLAHATKPGDDDSALTTLIPSNSKWFSIDEASDAAYRTTVLEILVSSNATYAKLRDTYVPADGNTRGLKARLTEKIGADKQYELWVLFPTPTLPPAAEANKMLATFAIMWRQDMTDPAHPKKVNPRLKMIGLSPTKLPNISDPTKKNLHHMFLKEVARLMAKKIHALLKPRADNADVIISAAASSDMRRFADHARRYPRELLGSGKPIEIRETKDSDDTRQWELALP